jgi:ATP-dependent Clp protease ATP-binding subunit ClpA
MTSNIGSDDILNAGTTLGAIGFAGDTGQNRTLDGQIKERITARLRDHFKPEFLNRVDDTITFHSLTQEQIGDIVELQLKQVAKRLREQRAINLTVSPAAKKLLAKIGFEPAYGARPLKRVIQKHILNPLSMKIITKEIGEGETAVIGAKGDEVTIQKKTEKELVNTK